MLARCARGSKGDVKRIKAKELKREDHEYLLHLIYIYIYMYVCIKKRLILSNLKWITKLLRFIGSAAQRTFDMFSQYSGNTQRISTQGKVRHNELLVCLSLSLSQFCCADGIHGNIYGFLSFSLFGISDKGIITCIVTTVLQKKVYIRAYSLYHPQSLSPCIPKSSINIINKLLCEVIY